MQKLIFLKLISIINLSTDGATMSNREKFALQKKKY